MVEGRERNQPLPQVIHFISDSSDVYGEVWLLWDCSHHHIVNVRAILVDYVEPSGRSQILGYPRAFQDEFAVGVLQAWKNSCTRLREKARNFKFFEFGPFLWSGLSHIDGSDLIML